MIILVVCLILVVLSVLAGFLAPKKPRFNSFAAKHVFITGGSSGIGLAIAENALLEGSYVTLCARNEAKLKKAVKELYIRTQCGKGRINYLLADVADSNAISLAVNSAFEWRPIDVLVCNAGKAHAGYIDEVPLKDLEAVLQTNVFGTLYTVHAGLPLMKNYRPDHTLSIVIIGSCASLYLLHGNAAYTSSKYALRGLAECLQLELVPYNIQVNLVLPGFVETPMLDDVEIDKDFDNLLERIDLYKRSKACSPKTIAKITLDGIKNGKFLVTTKELVPLVALVAAGRGFTPSTSLVATVIETFIFPFVRLASWIHAFIARRLIMKYHMKREALYLAKCPS